MPTLNQRRHEVPPPAGGLLANECKTGYPDVRPKSAVEGLVGDSAPARCILCGGGGGESEPSACTDGHFKACVLCNGARFTPCSDAGRDPTPSDKVAWWRLVRENYALPLRGNVAKVHRREDNGESTKLALLRICDEDLLAAKRRNAWFKARTPRAKAKLQSPV